MNSSNIKSLLKKYWDADTNLKEEESIKQFYLEKPLTEESDWEQHLFHYFEFQKKLTTKEDYNILYEIESNLKNKRKNSIQRFYLRIGSVAAILILGVFVLNTHYKNIDNQGNLSYIDGSNQEIIEAKLAYKEIKAALLFTSTKLNKGLDKAQLKTTKSR